MHEDKSICKPFYSLHPVIPKYSNRETYLFISSVLQLSVFCFLLINICRKQWYLKIKKNPSKAKSILLPFYDRIIYWYCFITLIQAMLYTIQLREIPKKYLFYFLIFEGISDIGLISLEIFLAFLLMQTTIGVKSFRRARNGTILFCLILIIFIFLKYYNTEFNNNEDDTYLIAPYEIVIHGLLLCVYIIILFYAYVYKEYFRERKRIRNRILYIYTTCVSLIHGVYVLSYALILFNIDGFCFIVIGEYMYSVIFPLIAFRTIKNDSLFWQNLFKGISTTHVHNHSPVTQSDNNDNDNDLKDKQYKNYRNSLRNIMGDHRRADTGISFYDPLIEAIGIQVNVIDFSELHDVSDPIAAGSTAMVHTAMYRGKKVAVKNLQFSELDISLEFITDLFRESLNSASFYHKNIVQFMGACLKPPELCLVYEYCNCGDLSHLLLDQYYNISSIEMNSKQFLINDAKQFKHRINILLGTAYGMTELHDNRIIHRDLKTDNVLVNYDNNLKRFTAKVCDFGSARQILIKKNDNINKDKDKDKKLNIFKINLPSSALSQSGVQEVDSIINIRGIGSLDNGIRRDYAGNIRVVNQIFLTAKVGTIAFMAPELLKHIDINKLSGGWNDKYDDTYSLRNTLSYLEMTPPLETPLLGSDNDNEEKYNSLTKTKTKTKSKTNKKTKKEIFNSLQSKFSKQSSKKMDKPSHHNTQKLPFCIKAKDEQDKINNLTILYDGAIDVFAFGIMLWEIGFLRRIYDNKNLKDIYNMITSGNRENIISYNECQMDKLSGFYDINQDIYEAYIKLMKSCWSQQPTDRPKFDKVRDELEKIKEMYENYCMSVGDLVNP